jgi:hypothetical protein
MTEIKASFVPKKQRNQSKLGINTQTNDNDD